MKATLALIAIGALAVLAGCGDDDGARTPRAATTTASLSRPAYLRRAAVICRQDTIDEEAKEFFAGYSRAHPPSHEKEAKFVNEVVIPQHQQQLDDLRSLPIPDGDEGEVKPFLAAAQAFLHRLAEKPSLYIEQRVTPEFEQAAKRARRYGLTACTI